MNPLSSDIVKYIEKLPADVSGAKKMVKRSLNLSQADRPSLTELIDDIHSTGVDGIQACRMLRRAYYAARDEIANPDVKAVDSHNPFNQGFGSYYVSVHELDTDTARLEVSRDGNVILDAELCITAPNTGEYFLSQSGVSVVSVGDIQITIEDDEGSLRVSRAPKNNLEQKNDPDFIFNDSSELLILKELNRTVDSGVSPLNARIVRKGDHYGRDNCLTHDRDGELIEFYDARHHGEGPVGQFISRYNRDILDGTSEWASPGYGINLDGGVPEWRLSANDHRRVVEWVDKTIPSIEQDMGI